MTALCFSLNVGRSSVFVPVKSSRPRRSLLLASLAEPTYVRTNHCFGNTNITKITVGCVFSLSITKLFSMHGDISCITSRSERKLSESMSVSGSGIGAAAVDIGGIVDILDIGGREGSLAHCFKEPEDREARKPGFAWPCVVRSFSLLKMNKDGLRFSLYLHTSCRCQTSSPLTFMLLTNVGSQNCQLHSGQYPDKAMETDGF